MGMNFLAKSIQSIIRVLLVIAAVALMTMMGIVVANVIGRIFFKSPVLGTVELAGLAGVVLIAVAVGITEREHRNVIVEVVSRRLPPRTRAIAGAFTLFLSLGAIAFLSWAVFGSALHAATTGEHTETLVIATAPFEFIWAIGALILCLFLLQHMIEAIIKGVKK
jgi:TRAP-type C4-dicarboxylate transport system permease small subunit